MSSSGVAVTPTSSLELSPVWSAVDKLSNAVALCPLRLYETSFTGAKGAEIFKHPVLDVLRNPNPHMTAFVFWKSRVINELLHGFSLSEISYSWGKPVGLWPVSAECVRIDFRFAERPFEIQLNSKRYYPELSQVVYVPKFAIDGRYPTSPIRKAEEAVGLGIAAEKFEANVFGRGSYPSVLLKHERKLSAEAKQSIKDMWEEEFSGINKSHSTAVLDEGMSVDKLSFSPQETEMLALREFQVREVSRFLGVPPHMLGDMSGATFSNVEQMGLEVLTWSVAPLLEARLQELQRKFFPNREYLLEFDTDNLTPQDRATRYATHSSALPWLSVNEIRRREGLDPLPEAKANSVPTTPGSQYLDDIPVSNQLLNWLQLYNDGKLSEDQIKTLCELAGLRIGEDKWLKLLKKKDTTLDPTPLP